MHVAVREEKNGDAVEAVVARLFDHQLERTFPLSQNWVLQMRDKLHAPLRRTWAGDDASKLQPLEAVPQAIIDALITWIPHALAERLGLESPDDLHEELKTIETTDYAVPVGTTVLIRARLDKYEADEGRFKFRYEIVDVADKAMIITGALHLVHDPDDL